MKIYIAGPMTGLPDYNYPAFNATAAELRAAGHEVCNPAENPEPECKSWAGYMRMALAQLVTCDSIYLLNEWDRSKGARIECTLAKVLGMRMMFAEVSNESARQEAGELMPRLRMAYAVCIEGRRSADSVQADRFEMVSYALVDAINACLGEKR